MVRAVICGTRGPGFDPSSFQMFFPTWISGGKENFKLDSIAEGQFYVYSSISTSDLASRLDILSQEFKEPLLRGHLATCRNLLPRYFVLNFVQGSIPTL